jgi:hypothetical protein
VIKNNQLSMENIERNAGEKKEDPEEQDPEDQEI